MDNEKIAKELVGLARDLTAEVDRQSFVKVSNKIEALRGRYEPTSDEAVFLGIVRDMAVHIGRGNWSAVKRLGLSIQDEMEEDLELLV